MKFQVFQWVQLFGWKGRWNRVNLMQCYPNWTTRFHSLCRFCVDSSSQFVLYIVDFTFCVSSHLVFINFPQIFTLFFSVLFLFFILAQICHQKNERNRFIFPVKTINCECKLHATQYICIYNYLFLFNFIFKIFSFRFKF